MVTDPREVPIIRALLLMAVHFDLGAVRIEHYTPRRMDYSQPDFRDPRYGGFPPPLHFRTAYEKERASPHSNSYRDSFGISL